MVVMVLSYTSCICWKLDSVGMMYKFIETIYNTKKYFLKLPILYMWNRFASMMTGGPYFAT